jgi:hypothetical protein
MRFLSMLLALVAVGCGSTSAPKKDEADVAPPKLEARPKVKVP